MPTSVINPREVLIVRLICHDEKVYEKIYILQNKFKFRFNCIQSGMITMMGTTAEKVPCELKDHIQHGL